MKYEIIYNGPLLFKTKIKPQEIKSLLQTCVKNKKLDMRKRLAGLIKDEYEIKDHNKLINILTPYLFAFKDAYQKWYDDDVKDIVIVDAWVNYMKEGECNPPHIHTGCDFSSVIYLNIPKILKQESIKAINNYSKPGSINFIFGPMVRGYISQKHYFPEVVDFYMFPHTLNHSVNSFKSKCERISLAINFNIIK